MGALGSVRLRKVLRDLFQERSRAILVLLALVVGGWGVALVSASTTVIQREIHDNFVVTRPAHATLTYRMAEGDDGADAPDIVAAAEALPWIEAAERRTRLMARARGGFDGRLPVVLRLVDDFEQQRVSTFELEQGRWPKAGELVLERDDLTVLGLEEAPASLEVQIPGGEWVERPVSGIVHDPGQAPARMEHVLYAYSPLGGGLESSPTRGAERDERGLLLRMAAPAVASRLMAQGHAGLAGEELTKQGFEILRVEVPEPEQHPHHGQMASMFFIQLAFGGLAMLLSVVVVIHMISSLMQRHVAQIGVLKSLGATPLQVGGLYLAMVAILGVVALLINIPLGLGLGLRYAGRVVEGLNFDLLSPGVPLEGWLVFLSVSLLVPLMAATGAVWRGLRVTVREALGGAEGADDPGLLGTGAVPIALRNVARRPVRMAMTILALAIGLGALASSFHVGASMRATTEAVDASMPFDLAISFPVPVDPALVDGALAPVADRLDGWQGVRGTRAVRLRRNGSTSDPFSLLLADPLQPLGPVVAGEWRLPAEGRALVVTTSFAAEEGVGVGDILELRLDEETARWPIAGVVRRIGGSFAYVLTDEPPEWGGLRAVRASLVPPTAEALGQALGSKIELRHGSRAPSLTTACAKYQAAAADAVEEALERAGIAVRIGSTRAELVAGLEDHIEIMVVIVALASMLIVAVGGLGLASAMSVSVLERTREIGVLRSLGATPAQLAQLFASEGAVVGGLSLALGIAISYPVGRAISDLFGNMMFKTPLDSGTSLEGAAWAAGVTTVLVLVVTVAALVQTLRQPTTAALRHE